MDYETTVDNAVAYLKDCTVSDPILRAALQLAVRPWLDAIHGDADAMRWGLFATAVQDVIEMLWPGPATVAIPAERGQPGPELDDAAIRVTHAAADVFTRASASRDCDPLSWQYAAAVAQLRDAGRHLA